MSEQRQISTLDLRYYKKIRKNVSRFVKECGKRFDKEGLLLDIAPQIHEGASPYFKKAKILTLDIDPNADVDYHLDICQDNTQSIPDEYFDFVVCTEVFEHTLDPFAAARQIYRMLKPEGKLFVSTPFNFRIHGPLPDCWRFTEHGLRVLLKDFTILELTQMEEQKRWLMPIHYTVIAQKK